MDSEWTTVVNKLKELFFAQSSFTAKECRAVLADKYEQQENPLVGSDLILYNNSDEPLGILKEIYNTAFSNRSLTEYLYNHPNRDQATSFEAFIHLPEGCYLLDSSNSKIEIKKLQLKGDCSFQIAPVPLEHRTYGKNQVAFGKVESAEGDVLISVVERDNTKMSCEMTLLDEKKLDDSLSGFIKK